MGVVGRSHLALKPHHGSNPAPAARVRVGQARRLDQPASAYIIEPTTSRRPPFNYDITSFRTPRTGVAMGAVILKAQLHEDLGARSSSNPTIAFRHPAYPDSDDVLFRLPRLDRTETVVAGVHHRIALQACQIIAGNAFHGYLATDRDGDPIAVPLDGLLTEDCYWFIVPRRNGDDEMEQRHGRNVYPVVPSFDDWQFPHNHFSALGWDWDNLPPTPLSTFAIPTRPYQQPYQRCILSNHAYAVAQAHIIPAANAAWFQNNNMKRYEEDQLRFINNSRNIIPMRTDLHYMWDKHVMAFFPKRGQFVAHVLTALCAGNQELADEFQNRPVQRGAFEGVAKEYLFAKFAQAVFMLVKPFIAFASVVRYVARLQADDKMGSETRNEWMSRESLRNLYGGCGSRRASASPSSSRKRSRSAASVNDEDVVHPYGYLTGLGCYCHGIKTGLDPAGRASDSGSEPDEDRGRPRKRRQRHGRTDHTVDTLPSLTDTSVDEEEDHLQESFSTTEGADPQPLKPPPLPDEEGVGSQVA